MGNMKITCISDLHGDLPEIEETDLLIIAGDTTKYDHAGLSWQWYENDFSEWLNEVPAEWIVGIGGNHDKVFEGNLVRARQLPWTYLQDSSTRIDEHVIWGSPWTPPFMNWHFMKTEPELREGYAQIPEETTILVTHGPPHGTLDGVKEGQGWYRNVGSVALKEALERLPNLKLHVFGHIHEQYGALGLYGERPYISVNASLLDDNYEMVHEPVVIEL